MLHNKLKHNFKLPTNLNYFQSKLYIHLVKYKREKLGILENGTHLYKDDEFEYDILLPKNKKELNLLNSIRGATKQYFIDSKIREHKFFSHMASSQAACFNLFMPLKLDPYLANKTFKNLLPEFNNLETIEFEYFDPKIDHLNEGRNPLATANIGTDSDVAVFYTNVNGERILCLLEHKLSENHFTHCNACKSNANDKKELCDSFQSIWENTSNCYYKSGKQYSYWELTNDSSGFINIDKLSNISGECPFKHSLQQLWRNTLLAQAMENSGRVKRAYFGVVYHGENFELWKTKGNNGYTDAGEYFQSLLKDENKFFKLTLQNIIDEVQKHSTDIWVKEYIEKYIDIKI